MGVIALVLYTNGTISSFYVPFWVKLVAGTAIGADVRRRLAHHAHDGEPIFKLEPGDGFAAQAAAGATIRAATKGSAIRCPRRTSCRAL